MKLLYGTILISSILVSGCLNVTYPKESLDQSVTEVLKHEYGLDARAKLIGRTLCIAVHFNILWEDGFVEKHAWELIGKVKFVAYRIAFSTDANIEFVDVMITGSDSTEELDYIRVLKDVRLSYSECIGTEDYWSREVLIRKEYTGNDPVFVDVKWEQFLAQQISQKVSKIFEELLSKDPQPVKIAISGGVFFDRKDPSNQVGYNLFALIIQSDKNPLEIDPLKSITQGAVDDVCRIYKSHPFERLRIYNMNTDTIFEITT